MDHLKTAQERKSRWYAKQITPRLIPIKDLDIYRTDSISHPFSCNENKGKGQEVREYINGVPFKSIIVDPKMKEYMTSHLKINGFVVITKALSIDECNDGLRLAWDYIEAASSAEHYLKNVNDQHPSKDDRNRMISKTSPIQRNDPSTYSDHFPRTVEGGDITILWIWSYFVHVVSSFSSKYSKYLCIYS